jgi:ectoine hydroxylase-related dioxygenase (phytanoyl-CoA dioxygenase family)
MENGVARQRLSQRFSPMEREQFSTAGFVVRERVFDAVEQRSIIDACEVLVEQLVRNRRGERIKFGSYVFDSDIANNVVIKWEGDSDVVHGIEPFAHLSPALKAWGYDARFVEPMQDIIGRDELELFTEKLNLKRPHHGGVNPLHQDYPYWIRVAEVAEEVATAMLFLDDADLGNGCLCVIPGSHRQGMWKTRTDGDRFAANEVDASAYPDAKSFPVEVPSGSVVYFGAMLVHHSAPNVSDRQRRALLYSYQPAGRRTQLDALRASQRRQ